MSHSRVRILEQHSQVYVTLGSAKLCHAHVITVVILAISIQASCAQYLVGAMPTVLCVAIF